MKRRTLIAGAALLTVLAGAAWRQAGATQPTRLAKPVFRGSPRSRVTFGDGRNVALFADLLKDTDAFIRARAVQGLGETHNDKVLY